MRLLLLVLFAATAFAEDVKIPLLDGTILIQNTKLSGTTRNLAPPELSFNVINETGMAWRQIGLQFDVQGCGVSELYIELPLEWTEGARRMTSFRKIYPHMTLSTTPLGCTTDRLTARLVQAENDKWRINGVSGEKVDLEEQRRLVEAERKTAEDKAAAAAERHRIAVKQFEERVAAEEASKRRLRAARKKEEAAAQAQYAKEKAKPRVTPTS